MKVVWCCLSLLLCSSGASASSLLDLLSQGGDLSSPTFKENIRTALASSDVNERKANGDTALLLVLNLYNSVTDSSDTEVLELLLDAGADCEVCGEDGMTPIVWATELCLFAPLWQIAGASSALRAYNIEGKSLEQIAKANDQEGHFPGRSPVYQFVLQLEKAKLSAFDRACYFARTGQASLLTKWANKQMAEEQDENGRTLLHLATLSGNKATIAAAKKLGCKGEVLDFYFQRADGSPTEAKPQSAQHKTASLKERRDLPEGWYSWLHLRQNWAVPALLPDQSSLLHYAKELSVGQIQQLLELGCDPNARDGQGYSSLDYLFAVSRSEFSVPLKLQDRLSKLSLLLAWGASLDMASKQWELSLADAGLSKDAFSLETRYLDSFLAGFALPSLLSADERQQIAEAHAKMLTAIGAGDLATVQALLETTSPDFLSDGFTPLQRAIVQNQDAIALCLIQDRGALNLVSTSKKTALGLAIESNKPNLIQELCKQDPNLIWQRSYSDKSQSYPPLLMLALEFQREDCIKVLLQAKAPRQEFDQALSSALINAAEADNLALCQLLLHEGASAIYQNTAGDTALHLAKSAPVARQLLQSGAKVDLPNHSGRTPLHKAATLPSSAVLDTLLAAGASLDMITPDGRSALTLAIAQNCSQTALTLLQHGAFFELRSLDGKTPLMLAAETGSVPITSALIAKKADLNAKDFAGDTALHLATEQQQAQTVALLLEAGCNPQMSNLEGKTPLGLANQLRNKEIARAILKKTNTPTARDWAYAITQISSAMALLLLSIRLMARGGAQLLSESYNGVLLSAMNAPKKAYLTSFFTSLLAGTPNIYSFISGAFWETDRLSTRVFLTSQNWAVVGSLSIFFAIGYNLNPLHTVMIGAVGLWAYLGLPRFTRPWLMLVLGIGLSLFSASFMKTTAADLAGAPLVCTLMDWATENAIVAALTGLILTLFFQSSSGLGIILGAFSLTGVLEASTLLLFLFGSQLGSALNNWLWRASTYSLWQSAREWSILLSFVSATFILVDLILESTLQVPLAIAFVKMLSANPLMQQLGLILVFTLLQALVVTIFYTPLFGFFDRHFHFFQLLPKEKPKFLPQKPPANTAEALLLLIQEQGSLTERLSGYFTMQDTTHRSALQLLDASHQNFKRIWAACETYLAALQTPELRAIQACIARQRKLDLLERSSYQLARLALEDKSLQEAGKKALQGKAENNRTQDKPSIAWLLRNIEEGAQGLKTLV